MAGAAAMAERDEDHLVLHGEARAGRVLKGEVRLAPSREGAAHKVRLVCTRHTPREFDIPILAALVIVSAILERVFG